MIASTADDRSLPDGSKAPRSILSESLRIFRAQAEWSALIATAETDAALALVDALDDLNTPASMTSKSLRQMREWRPKALIRRGRAEAARQALDHVERDYSTDWSNRWNRGQLCYHRGDLDGAVKAYSEAMILLRPGAGFAASYDLIAHAWADTLTLKGEHKRARRLLENLFVGRKDLNNANIKALRQTIHDDEDLEAFAAFLAPTLARPGALSRAALYHYSLGCRMRGRYREAEAFIRHRFITAASGAAFGSRSSPKKSAGSNWTGDARTTLLDLNFALGQASARPFLISGTLLGCIRENDILGHDKDIDVGVMDTPELDRDAVHASLKRSGSFSVKTYQSQSLLRLQHASGVMVDVFWHREENGIVIHEGLKSRWWNEKFDLMERKFLGVDFLVPKNYDLYLTENYGDWRTPNTEFETFVDTPNMIITHHDEMIWYYYSKLYDYYINGKSAQFAKVADAVLKLRPRDRETASILSRVQRQAT